MADKKRMTTIRWIVVAVLLVVAVGIFVAMLASGHEPSLHFIGSIVFVLFFVGLVIWANLAKKKSGRTIAEQKARAAEFATNKEYGAAICMWKELLPHVGEPHVREILPELQKAYEDLGSSEGPTMLKKLQKLYDDFFDMTKRLKQLDAKGRTMRQSLADKICETVNELPES